MRHGEMCDTFATTIAQGVRDTESLGRGGSGGYDTVVIDRGVIVTATVVTLGL